jgi:XTP/dITP diphosphohydrolase
MARPARKRREIYFVTTNLGKVHSAQKVFSRYGFSVVQKKASIDEPEYTNDPRLIAKAKVVAASKRYKRPVMCEDGGFFVEALGGKPGVKVKGYLEKYGLSGLLNRMRGKRNRRVCFWGVLAYDEPGWKKPVYFESKTHGVLTREPRGTLKPYSWSELHLAFIPDSHKKTLAELSEKEYLKLTGRQTSRFTMLAEFLKGREATGRGRRSSGASVW